MSAPLSPPDREQARLTVLRYLDAAADAVPGRGIATAVLMQHLRAEGFSGMDRAGVDALAEYLAGKGLVARAVKHVSSELPEWIITAAGRDYYATLAASEA